MTRLPIDSLGEKATLDFKRVLRWEITTHPIPGRSTRRAAAPRQTRPR